MASQRRTGPEDEPTLPAEISTKEGREEFARLRELLSNRSDDLGWHHDLGAGLENLSRMGLRRGGVVPLGIALGLSRVGVYQHLQFVERYPEKDRVVRLGRSGLGWAMVVALLGVLDARVRADLETQAVEKKWTTDRLRLEIARRQGEREGAGGRRSRPGRPGRERSILSRLEDALAAIEALGESPNDAATHLREELLQGDTANTERLQEFSEMLDRVLGYLTEVKRRVTGK